MFVGKKKKWVDKKRDPTFQVVHRSHLDTEDGYVLKPQNAKGKVEGMKLLDRDLFAKKENPQLKVPVAYEMSPDQDIMNALYAKDKGKAERKQQKLAQKSQTSQFDDVEENGKEEEIEEDDESADDDLLPDNFVELANKKIKKKKTNQQEEYDEEDEEFDDQFDDADEEKPKRKDGLGLMGKGVGRSLLSQYKPAFFDDSDEEHEAQKKGQKQYTDNTIQSEDRKLLEARFEEILKEYEGDGSEEEEEEEEFDEEEEEVLYEDEEEYYEDEEEQEEEEEEEEKKDDKNAKPKYVENELLEVNYRRKPKKTSFMMDVTSETFRGAVDKFYEDRKLLKQLGASATVVGDEEEKEAIMAVWKERYARRQEKKQQKRKEMNQENNNPNPSKQVNAPEEEKELPESDSSSEDEREEVEVSDHEEEWDVESILSTVSNLDNHPRLISEARKPTIKLSAKSGLPVGALPSRKPVEVAEPEPKVNRGLARNKSETPEEKRERKAQQKEDKKIMRQQKKGLKMAFKSEELNQKSIKVVNPGVKTLKI